MSQGHAIRLVLSFFRVPHLMCASSCRRQVVNPVFSWRRLMMPSISVIVALKTRLPKRARAGKPPPHRGPESGSGEGIWTALREAYPG